jgi:hypothetical protein
MLNLRYGLVNVFLILGSVKEIRFALIIWIVATVITLIWEFTLLAILFSYDTTVGQLMIRFTSFHEKTFFFRICTLVVAKCKLNSLPSTEHINDQFNHY